MLTDQIEVFLNYWTEKAYTYGVYADGRLYDSFTSIKPLTSSQQFDVAREYEKALDADC